jgi:general secretion pathway protein M
MNPRQWWNGLEARERRTLAYGGVALAIILYVFLIWLPAHRGADRLETRLTEQRALLSWMQQAAAEAQSLRGADDSGTAVGTGGQALFSFVDQSAREAGLADALRQVEPTGDRRIRVTLQQANFDVLMHWLARLQSRHGVDTSALSVRRTDAPGLVDAQLVLESQAP